MCDAIIQKCPPKSYPKEGAPVTMKTIVRRKGVTQEQIDSFLWQHKNDRSGEDKDGLLTLERPVIVASSDGLRRQAFRLLTDMKTHFGFKEIMIC